MVGRECRLAGPKLLNNRTTRSAAFNDWRYAVTKLVLLAVAALLSWSPPVAAQSDTFDLKEWPVEWGGRTRDPAIAPDGKVWFVGQAGNYIANLDPVTGAQKQYTIEEGTNPHTLIVDEKGIVWYAGNRNGRIGRLDPATGAIKVILTGDAKDPHTMVFDGKGHIWFTSQGSNRVGRLNMATEKVDLVTPNDTPSNPYGIKIDAKGIVWVALLRVGMIARIDPQTLAVTRFREGGETSRSRRLDVLADGTIWFGDEARGMLGRLSPATGDVKEWPVPGGPKAGPYALTKDDQDRIWFSEVNTKRLVGFDPKTEKFFANIEVSGAIRNMHFDRKTQTMWFGTDANNVGRIRLQNAN
jgi:virginiamycin B lyase